MSFNRLLHLVGIVAAMCWILQGCASSVQPAANVDVNGTIAVYMPAPLTGKEMQLPKAGPLSDSGRGAVVGSTYGAAIGVRSGMMGIILVPLLASVGAVGGAAYGAVAGDSHALAEKTDRLLSGVVKESDIGPQLATEIATHLTDNGFPSIALLAAPENEQTLSTVKKDYELAVEIDSIIIELVPDEIEVKPRRRLQVTSHIRLIHCNDRGIIDKRDVVYEQGPTRTLEEWIADGAAEFRLQLPLAMKALAEQIVTEQLLSYTLPPKIVGTGGFFDAKVYGLVPLRPRIGDCVNPKKTIAIDSLQPMFSWEPYVAESVTYDLCIWKAREEYDAFYGRIIKLEAVVYSRKGLTDTTHTVATSLNRKRPTTGLYGRDLWKTAESVSLPGANMP